MPSARVPLRRQPRVLAVLATVGLIGTFASARQPSRALGVDTAGFDRSIRPQDDFNGFVNGGWIQKTEIPPDRSSWGSFVELSDRSDAALKDIIETATKTSPKPGSQEQQVADFYRSFMDTARIESLGTDPLRAELKRIADVTTIAELPALLGHLAHVGVRGPFFASVGQDQKQSDTYIVSVSQGGLGMPDRDYYLRQDSKFDATRSAYSTYITRLLTLAKQPDPAGAAERILALETRIARQHWERARNRDRDATYNKMTVDELATVTPAFGWATYFRAAGLEATHVVVRQPDYFSSLDAIISGTPLSTWKEALTYGLLATYADELPAAFGEAQFEFRGRTLSGQEEMRPRWKRGISEVESALGEALGRLYVERYFAPDAKARMDQLVKNLLAAFSQGIDELEWMSPETRAQAHAKLAKFTVKIGYPDTWRDYSTLTVRRDDLLGNAMRANGFAYDDMAGRLGKPVDRGRWSMTPQTVNAYYNSTNNEIVFPAAILQPPFFNVEADDAVNYGGIGAVIGHEISHGFDDQGSKSDGDGNLRNWFTPEDLKAFQDRTSKLADQYAAYNPIDDLHINGRLTLGENIGDLSGLAVALRAYHMSLGGKPAPVIDGFSGDQRFFLGWAQVWRSKIRDDALRQQLLTNPHSPGHYRAFVSLTNMQAFYDAWDVKPGDKMYRPAEERVKIW
ncbi:MAG: M13 family metallopeptidase [Acidobacteriota bacterium]|nr:M13 family metallopeptidase [Acidobacteriota bacterium]